MTLAQGEAGNITFSSIRFEPDHTWVEYEVHGSNPYAQDMAWFLEDKAGERYSFDYYDKIRLSDDSYSYRAALPSMDSNELVRIGVIQLKAPKILKELELQIPLR